MVYLSSADLMPRNLDTRVELAVPVEAPALRAEILDMLELCFADNRNGWDLHPDATWTRRTPGDGEVIDVQAEMMRRHAELAP